MVFSLLAHLFCFSFVQVEQMKKMRAEMKKMALELREKEKRLKLLVNDWNKRPKSVDRSQYVTLTVESVDCCILDFFLTLLFCCFATGTPLELWSPFDKYTSRRQPLPISCAIFGMCRRTSI